MSTPQYDCHACTSHDDCEAHGHGTMPEHGECESYEPKWTSARFDSMLAAIGPQVTTSAKHTPGPWTNDGANISVPGMFVCNPGPSVPSVEMHANARLIAAAPEMYAALCSMRAAYWATNTKRGTMTTREHVTLGMAALARAEGRAPADTPPSSPEPAGDVQAPDATEDAEVMREALQAIADMDAPKWAQYGFRVDDAADRARAALESVTP